MPFRKSVRSLQPEELTIRERERAEGAACVAHEFCSVEILVGYPSGCLQKGVDIWD